MWRPVCARTLNFVGLDQLCGAAGWGDAGVIVPWTLWRMYGDTRIVERHWRAMTAWLRLDGTVATRTDCGPTSFSTTMVTGCVSRATPRSGRTRQ